MSVTRTFQAPGRVNLIGEHTDYNLGFVLPIALNLNTQVQARASDDGRLHVSSDRQKDSLAWKIRELPELSRTKHWTDYVAGVARQLALRGIEIPPLHLSIRSDIPDGCGLSSSAALEVSVALALLQGREFDRLELAQLCQRAETEFVGMPCGIMDQYVSVFGEAHSALCIDCRSLDHRTVTLPERLEIIAVNSMVRHELRCSAYRIRVEECRIAVQAIARIHPQVQSLRDARPEHLDKAQMPRVVMRRARHIISENKRVELFVGAAARGDVERMGELSLESHRSMQHDYEITCDEVDFLVEAAAGMTGCYGARMTGGGFGGCTINLVAPEAAERFENDIRALYKERFGAEPEIFRCVPSAGACEIF